MTGLAAERLRKLADPGSFTPFDDQEGAGILLGTATVGGRPIHVKAFEVDKPPRVSPLQSIVRQNAFLEHVREHPAPLVQFLDIPAHHHSFQGKTPIPPDGLRLLAAQNGVGRGYALEGLLEGLVPRISVLFGLVGSALSFPAALCDATVMLEGSALCIGRPDAVTLMTGQRTDYERLGGARMHCERTGTGHRLAKTEEGALAWARQWLGYLPTRAGEPLPVHESLPPRGDLAACAEAAQGGVPVQALLDALVDGGSWLELGELHAGECLVGLCRLGGRSVGLLASNPAKRGGILFPETCRKMTRFVRFCGWFGLPTVFLADTPGFMIGEEVEANGSVQAAAELYTAIARSPAPKVCVVVGKAYSAGLYAMGGAAYGADFWAAPGASVSVFGPEALRRFAQDRDMSPASREAADSMLQGALHPESLVEMGLVDEVVPWGALREKLVAFAAGRRQEGRHG